MEQETIRIMAAGDRLRLERTDGYYELAAGEIELYVVWSAASREGMRRYMDSIAAGQSFFGLADRTIHLLAVAAEPAQIIFHRWEEAAEFWPPRPIEQFMRLFLATPRPSPRPHVFQEIAPGETAAAAAGAIIKIRDSAIAWLKAADGELRDAQGRPAPGNILPMSPADAAVAGTNCTLRAYHTADFLPLCPRAFIETAMRRVMERFALAHAAYFAEQEASYEQRLDEREQEKELLVANSYAELLKNLIPSLPVVIRPHDKTQPPTIHALRQIASFLGLKSGRIRLPAELAATLVKPQDIVREISRAGALRGRRVLLEPGWHRKDQGPLLIFRGGAPAAAIPQTPVKYRIDDPATGRRRIIDDQLAAEIALEAFTFYHGMPASVSGVRQWLKWAAGLCWRHDYWVLFFTCLIVGFIPVVTPLITQTVFEDITPSFDKQAHLMVVQVMFVTGVAGALTSLVRGLTVMRMKNHIQLAAEAGLWLKLLSLPADFFRRYQIGDLAQRMQNISQLSGQFSSVVAGGLFNGLFCFWNLIVMAYFSFKLSRLVLLIWAIYAVISLFFSWRLIQAQRRKMEASSQVAGQTLQLLSGLSKFRLRAAEERAFYLWARRFGLVWRWNRLVRWQTIWLSLFGQTRALVVNFFIFWVTIDLFDVSLKEGAAFLSQANFLSFNAAMGAFGAAVAGLLNAVNGLLASYPALERVRPVIEERPETAPDKPPAGDLSGALETLHLNFRYKPELPLVLKNISFSVRPGAFLAVVGSSGSGKSTLLRLLIGLERPTKGVVLYDGQDLADLDVASVRGQIGVVMQHGRLMAGSICDNIVGSLPLTLDDAWEAAKMAGLDGDLREMPMGMHTVISEGGGNISGGQRQRILIARSLAGRPRIVIFDEATSALDNAAQAVVATALAQMKATRIVVAHRLSTIEKADHILVLERGELVEAGSFAELLAKNGQFAALIRRQLP